MIPESEWQWYGVSGHFICGRWCRFHLATVVGKYIVSTVGEYVHPRHGMGNERDEAAWLKLNWPGEDIGWKRKYETMVFKCGKPCSEKDCGCGMPEIDGSELDSSCYNARGDATRGHLAMCRKYAQKNPELDLDDE